MINLSTIVLAAAWFYPQMDLEIYRVNKMWQESDNVGMRAAHPGEVAKLRDCVEFRRKRDDGTYETKKICPVYHQPAFVHSEFTNWEAKTFDGEWRPCSKYPDSEIPPHLIDVPRNRELPAPKYNEKEGYYDAGMEMLAYIECESESEPKFYLGESVDEMNETDPERMEYIPKIIQVGEKQWRTPVPYAFRYFRFGKTGLTCFPRNVKLVEVGKQYKKSGSFECDNERWNKMFEVGKRTLLLCSQDFLIDGIKRDRLPWAGDMAVSLMATAYVFGDGDIVRRSLSVMDAYTGDVNGIVTYSMWTIIAHDMYQLYFGDRDFLNERWWRVKWRVENLISRCDERGFVVKGLDWVFVDWTNDVDPCAMQMIWVGALDAAAKLADRMGDKDAAKYRELASKVRKELNAKHWNDKKGMYGVGRHASVYAVIFNVADAAKVTRIGENLAKDEIAPVGTPYIYGWELVALKRAGYTKEFFNGLEKVFGAMLDNGATTFWEGYDATEKGADMYRFYGRPFAKSLCHVWSAWPAFLFVSEVMGIKPTADGWKEYEEKPMDGAKGLRATILTPRGVLTFGNDKAAVDKSKFKLVVLGGQSNMSGRGKIDPSDNKPHPRVVMLNRKGEWVPCVDPIHYDEFEAGVGPGKAFAEALADSDPSITVGVIPTAVGGTSIKSWVPGGVSYRDEPWHPYDDMVARTKLGQERGTLAAILWHQGESDEMRKGGYLYQYRFPEFVDRFRREVGAEGVPLIIGGVRDGVNDYFGKIVSNAQRWTCEYAFGPGKFVPCDPKCALESDNIHFTREVQRDFGRRYFAAYQEVMKKLAEKPGYWKDPESDAAKIKAAEIPGWKDNKYNDGDKQMGLVPAVLPDIVEKWLFPNGRPVK